MSELIDKRNQQTRAEIAEGAIALFLELGFQQTSMVDVAEAAGVSRRTAYRHFESKDELVFEQPRLWLEELDRVVNDRREGEATRDLIRRALFAVSHFIEQHAEAVLRAYAVLVATPSLLVRHGKSDQQWRALCATLIAADLPNTPAAVLEASVAAGALVGATNALIATWAAQQPNSKLIDMTRITLDQIDSVWPGECRSA